MKHYVCTMGGGEYSGSWMEILAVFDDKETADRYVGKLDALLKATDWSLASESPAAQDMFEEFRDLVGRHAPEYFDVEEIDDKTHAFVEALLDEWPRVDKPPKPPPAPPPPVTLSPPDPMMEVRAVAKREIEKMK